MIFLLVVAPSQEQKEHETVPAVKLPETGAVCSENGRGVAAGVWLGGVGAGATAAGAAADSSPAVCAATACAAAVAPAAGTVTAESPHAGNGTDDSTAGNPTSETSDEPRLPSPPPPLTLPSEDTSHDANAGEDRLTRSGVNASAAGGTR